MTTETTVTPTTTATPAPVVEQPVPGTVTVVKSEKTPWVHAGLEVRFGPLWFDDVGSNDNPLTDVYGSSGNNVLLLEGGPSIKDVLQLEFGIGRYHRKGHLVAEGGEQSNDESVITLYPVTVGGRIRLDFLREQWIVPTAAAGLDYWLWSEKAGYNSDTLSWDAKNSGGHYGYHYAGGLQILLDTFEPKRASQLQARAGIEDSYLVAEYRHREVGEEEDGFKFTGSEVTVGLRIAY